MKTLARRLLELQAAYGYVGKRQTMFVADTNLPWRYRFAQRYTPRSYRLAQAVLSYHGVRDALVVAADSVRVDDWKIDGRPAVVTADGGLYPLRPELMDIGTYETWVTLISDGYPAEAALKMAVKL